MNRLKKWSGIVPFVIISAAISVILQVKGVSFYIRDISFMLRPLPDVFYVAAALLAWRWYIKLKSPFHPHPSIGFWRRSLYIRSCYSEAELKAGDDLLLKSLLAFSVLQASLDIIMIINNILSYTFYLVGKIALQPPTYFYYFIQLTNLIIPAILLVALLAYWRNNRAVDKGC
ncbi:MAG TPA: hypothetical protein DEF34_12905 [Desulfotomaculum sp.]|nr:MAG: hypothetical protein VR67_01860 [Peptococcaceae bacterium BRH_c8a]KJS75812.1 MAG: hypothetical protein JL56_06750 [Desulfotomaculum sp. BICA1-6]HBX24510.1 hypothetical protein [Desulfotomaculum sp.]